MVLFALLAGLLTHAGVWAQEPAAKNERRYATRVWQTQDGLPRQTVQALAQTSDGFLWVGTTGGLVRFDGARFVVFDRSNTPAIEENSIFGLTRGRDGSLWIATEGGGLVRMHNGQFQHYGSAEGLQEGFVRCVLEDSKGKVWVGTDNGLYMLPNSEAARVHRVDGASGVPSLAVHALAEAKDGTVWIGGSTLVSVAPGGETKEFALAGEYSETRVKSIVETRDGTVWVGTVSGLQRLHKGTQRFERMPGLQGTVRRLTETSDGTLWVGTIGLGAWVVRNGTLQAIADDAAGSSLQSETRLPSKTVLSIFEDAGQNVWIGTQAGLVRLSRSRVQLVALPGASDSDFETVSADTDGALWVASSRLFRIAGERATPVSFAELKGARVRNVFRAADGAVWVGTDGSGLFILREHGVAQHFTTANGLVNNFVRGVMQTREGDVWVGTDEGVSRFAEGRISNLTMANGLVYFSVRSLLQDATGDVWIGTDRGLTHVHGGSVVQDAATLGLAGEKVWSLAQSSSGTLWMGTRDDGLYAYRGGVLAHLTAEQGLATSSAYSIAEDRQQRLWIGGVNGIDVLSVAELESLIRNRNGYISQRLYAVSETADLSPLYGGTMPAVAKTADGALWFPTSKGPARLQTSEVEGAVAPQIFVDSVVADGRTFTGLAQSSKLQLPANNRNLEIAYGPILLGPQDAVQMQYKLENFDPDWRYSGNRRLAEYTNLPAGHYVFRLRAFGGDSGAVVERSIRIEKEQYFFLRWWFLSLCALVLVLMVWTVHRQKLRRVELAYGAVIEERARLAREMHDTLIQGCVGVSLLLETASAQTRHDPESGEASSELLNYARTQLAASIDEARQAVWNLRGNEGASFTQALARLAERIDRESSVRVHCAVEGEAFPIESGAMHELLMVCREAMYNALLHAAPARLDVRTHFGEEEFVLNIVDDGMGFDPESGAGEGHFGMLGIEERVRRLGGVVRWRSARRQGTELSVRIPKRAVIESVDEREGVLSETQMEEVRR